MTRSISPRLLTPDAAALILLSRDRIVPGFEEAARERCEAVENWDWVIEIAARKLSAPYVYHNLVALYSDGAELSSVIDAMRPAAMAVQMATLRVHAAQVAFHERCLAPLGVRHAYLKGPALAARFHRNPGYRFARDIDVLLDEDDLRRVVTTALAAGYQLHDTSAARKRLDHARDRRALLRYSSVVMLLSPEGVPIELHREIDKNLGVFDNEALLAGSTPVTLGGGEMNTLAPEVMFTFACYHNTRHLWSHLHWLADLSAMLSHPALSLAKAQRFADGIGLGPTVTAAVEFDAIAARGGLTECEGYGARLMELCLTAIEGDVAQERRLREKLSGDAVPFRWLMSGDAGRVAGRRHLARRFAPSFEQYRSLPLPEALQWLYYPMKPFYGAIKRWRRHG
ncbi:MAG: nucleotidyltransferase family protein [Pseudomonadota bacterium]